MEIENIIKDKNFKLTKARKELLHLFEEANRPISYDDVKEDVSMDKATFYRNVAKFEEVSILRSVQSNDKKSYYELQKTETHAHFICNECQKIECVEIAPVFLQGYEITDTIFKGYCPQCRAKSI